MATQGGYGSLAVFHLTCLQEQQIANKHLALLRGGRSGLPNHSAPRFFTTALDHGPTGGEQRGAELGSPVALVVGGAGAFARNRGGSERVLRGAARGECQAVHGLLQALQNLSADAPLGLFHNDGRCRNCPLWLNWAVRCQSSIGERLGCGSSYSGLIMIETPLLTVLIPAAAALCGTAVALAGVLGNQLMATKATLKTRRLELYFQAKASGYKALLERMGEFGCRPLDHAKNLTFLAAHETAFVFASDEVAELLSGPTGISVNAQLLRSRPTEDERSKVAFTTWYDATKAASTAMRNDLKRLSGGLQ